MLNKGLLVAALALSAAGAANAADRGGVRIEHAAARVVVIPEARGDYAISINPGRAGLKPLSQRRDGGVLVVDGAYGAPIGFHWGWNDLNCKGPRDHERVSVPGRGDVAVADLPVITIRTPLDARIGASGAVFGEIAQTQALDLSNAGCGDWTVADVRGPLRISISGSGDVHAQASGEARVAISGSADVALGSVNGRLETQTSGSGDIRVASVHGPVSTQIGGSGDVLIDGGQAGDVHVAIGGSGDFTFKGVAAAVSASIGGSGVVHIDRATGPVSKSIGGSGDVVIGH